MKNENKTGPVRDGRYLLHMGSAMMIGALLMLWGLSLVNRTRPAPIVLVPPPPTATPAPTATAADVRVYVSGEVARPGVFELRPGGIAEDAVEAAGGPTDQSFLEGVNLAQPLYDGLQIYVPAKDEREEALAAVLATPTPAGVRRVDLNTATQSELETLPGIGPSMAQRIIAYREENGGFETVEELLNVRGIGETRMEQLRGMVEVE